MKRVSVFVIIAVVVCTIPAMGWGKKGHRIVATVAQNHLTPTAKKNLAALLGQGKTLASVAVWADNIKYQRPDTKPWHYVDILANSSGYDAARDCTDNRGEPTCVVEEIELFSDMLADKTADKADRVEALKFLVHFTADIACPMHAIGEANGGNQVHVTFLDHKTCGSSSSCNLHALYDTGLLEHAGLSEQKYVAHLESMIKDQKLKATGTPEDWANGSWSIAKAAWAADKSNIDQQYYDKEITVVDTQMALAGLRLAKVLNSALK